MAESGYPRVYAMTFMVNSAQAQASITQLGHSFTWAGQQFEQAGQAAQRTGFAISRAAYGWIFNMQMLLWYVSMFASGMMRAESASLMLEQAQENYRRAVERYGRSSYEARRALRSLQRVQNLSLIHI